LTHLAQKPVSLNPYFCYAVTTLNIFQLTLLIKERLQTERRNTRTAHSEVRSTVCIIQDVFIAGLCCRMENIVAA